MGEYMSYLSINNAVAVRDEYRQVASNPAQAVSNAPATVSVGAHHHVSRTDEGRSGYRDTADSSPLLTKLLDMFTQFFTQLQSLLSDTRSKVTPDVAPTPQPRVMPKPELPLPQSRVSHLPDLSTKRNGAKPDDIWGGFRQGPDGNCVTISAIKAAMAKFGQSPTDIFKSVETVGDGYQVVMRDGYKLNLKKSELTHAIRGSKFVLMRDPGMLKDAHFLFAVSAKRAQLENNDGRASRSFDAAVRSLNDGEDERGAGEGFLRLGLKSHMKKVPVSAFSDKSLIGMVNRSAHSVAIIDGCEELYGRKSGRPRFGDAIALV